MTAACCTSPASGNCYWPCLKPQERLELSHSRGVQKPPGRLHPVHAPCSADHLQKGGDQARATQCASNSKLQLLRRLNLPHQHGMPSGRLPGSHQPHPRPFVGRPINLQARQFERRWRRSAFDCGGPERRGSARRLKLPLHGQHAEAAMRFAHPKLFQSQSSTGTSVASGRAAKATIGPAGFELRLFGRFEKRRRSRLAPAVEFSLVVCAGGTSCPRTPCFAREELCHKTLFWKARCRSKTGILPLLHRGCTVPTKAAHRAEEPSN